RSIARAPAIFRPSSSSSSRSAWPPPPPAAASAPACWSAAAPAPSGTRRSPGRSCSPAYRRRPAPCAPTDPPAAAPPPRSPLRAPVLLKPPTLSPRTRSSHPTLRRRILGRQLEQRAQVHLRRVEVLLAQLAEHARLHRLHHARLQRRCVGVARLGRVDPREQ